jgi:hypothetical protein
MRGNRFREPLGEDGSWTTRSTTTKAAHSETEDQLPTGDGQISDDAVLEAVDTLGPRRTERAVGEACRCRKVERDRLAVERHPLEAETSQMRAER